MATQTAPSQPDIMKIARDFGRAGGGALIFSLPMLMTAELWSFGLSLDRTRILTLLLVSLPLLVVLSRHIGFEHTGRWRDDIFDSIIAMGVAATICTVLLVVFGVITLKTPIDESTGKIAIQIVPASMGALLAKSQFAMRSQASEGEDRAETYGGEIFLMAVGALFLGFNVAPTEDLMLISFQMAKWQALILLVLSLAVMHGFVFAVGFAGGSQPSRDEPWWSAFVRLTLPGYALALAISLFLLWIFTRTDGLDIDSIAMASIVLAFPCSLGAAAARLIL